ncbi:hypothetical protein BGZ76_002933 [Entomortierella beljakovae]|nr:hypothetical protein BGZ76_002933 [Entomortierella beljakovae]
MSQDTVPPTKVEIEEDDLKVFVGNLAFQTTEEQLTETFSKPNPVVKVNIITRGTRSLGYGFVTYEAIEHVKAAVEAHNKSQLGGREINVEVAKRIVERPQAAPKERTPKKPRESNKDSAENGDAPADVKPRAGRNARPRRKTNKNKPRRPVFAQAVGMHTDKLASVCERITGHVVKRSKEKGLGHPQTIG